MVMDAQMILGVVVTGVAGLVWLIRLEGRITLNESMTKTLSEDIRYVRARIDRALNSEHEP